MTFLLAASAAWTGARPETPADVVFEWGFERRAGADWEAVEVADTLALAAGDEVRFVIRPVTAGTFVYLLVQEADGTVALLFPREVADFAARGYEGAEYLVPSDGEAFRLTGSPASERFTLIASSERLRAFESSVTALRKAGAADLAAARQRVLDEVAALRRQHSTLAVVAERPVAIAGSVRTLETKSAGVTGDLEEATWTRIEAVGFYLRTIRIAH